MISNINKYQLNKYILILSFIFAIFVAGEVFSEKIKYYLKEDVFQEDQLLLDEVNLFYEKNNNCIADGFDYPVGFPDAKGYSIIRPFRVKLHLGEDWVGKKNYGFGDPVYSIAHGTVKLSQYAGRGWGNVVMITHRLPDGTYINSLYGHLKDVYVKKGQAVKRGKVIGTIGDADKKYIPHLHFEIRDDFFLGVEGGYSRVSYGYLNPIKFINDYRSIPSHEHEPRRPCVNE